MASTYSPLLRIELIGTGEQAGVWGDTTNTNLGTLIEQAIAGTTTFSVTSADVTLSDLDGESDQARCAILNVTGTPGVSRNIIAPASSKTYIVRNNSDAQVIIKTSSSTGMVVPSGYTQAVVFDGTDFTYYSPPINAEGDLIAQDDLTFTGSQPRLYGDFSGIPFANRLAIQSNGTTAPHTNVSLVPAYTASSGETTAHLRVDDNTSFSTSNGTFGSFLMAQSSDVRLEVAVRGTGSYIPMTFWNGGAEKMRLQTTGEFMIAGTTDQGAYNLQVNGTGVWGAGAYVNGSDAKLKENVADIGSCLDVVKAMRPVTFQYKQTYSKDQSIQPGFIAQELQTAMEGKTYLNGVVQEGKKNLNVAYQNIIPILTKAIQEQQEQINELKAEIAALKGA